MQQAGPYNNPKIFAFPISFQRPDCILSATSLLGAPGQSGATYSREAYVYSRNSVEAKIITGSNGSAGMRDYALLIAVGVCMTKGECQRNSEVATAGRTARFVLRFLKFSSSLRRCTWKEEIRAAVVPITCMSTAIPGLDIFMERTPAPGIFSMPPLVCNQGGYTKDRNPVKFPISFTKFSIPMVIGLNGGYTYITDPKLDSVGTGQTAGNVTVYWISVGQ